MITKTLNLDSKYTDLFNEIRDKSNGTINVNNLESFFGSIQEIAALDSKFLRLPLDEPMFEIDANTRVISIPAHFKSNGLSVRGDNRAEMVFFSVDRYFDLTDLNNTNISINWKMGADSGKIEDLQKLFSSTDILPGKLVFGWPIEDIVTKKSGALSFAVEFQMKDNENKIIYNLNTLVASINIKDGLILGEDAQVAPIDKAGFLSILQNSQFGEGDAAVGELTWTSAGGSLVRKDIGTNVSVTLAPYENPTMLKTILIDGVPSSQTATFYGEAYVDAGTDIYYTDSANNNLVPTMLQITQTKVLITDRSNLDENKIYFDGDGPSSSQIDFADIDDVENLYSYNEIDPNWLYFVKTSDNPVAYRPATDEEVAAWGTADMITLYINVAAIEVSEAGTYIIKAQGVKKDATGHKIGNGAVVACTPLVIPAVEIPSNIEIEKSEINLEDENYSFDTDASANVVFFNDNSCTLTASAVVNNYGALQFNWKKDNEAIVENVPFKIDITSPIEGFESANSDTLTITEPGEYKVEVINFQNGQRTEPVVSQVFTASKLAGKIESAKTMFKVGNSFNFAEVNGQIRYNSGVLSANKVTLTVDDVTIEEDGARGNITCDWYKVTGLEDEKELVANNVNTFTITSGDGAFIPVVKNIYNGSIYSFELPIVNIDDIA